MYILRNRNLSASIISSLSILAKFHLTTQPFILSLILLPPMSYPSSVYSLIYLHLPIIYMTLLLIASSLIFPQLLYVCIITFPHIHITTIPRKLYYNYFMHPYWYVLCIHITIFHIPILLTFP